VNDHDRKNVNFILTRSQADLIAWYQALEEAGDQAEIDYALELLIQAKCLIEMDLLSLLDQDAEEDVSQAADYLQRFRLQ
jgi:hypothetical protein